MVLVREDREAFRTAFERYVGAVARFAGHFSAIRRGEEIAQMRLQLYRARERAAGARST